MVSMSFIYIGIWEREVMVAAREAQVGMQERQLERREEDFRGTVEEEGERSACNVARTGKQRKADVRKDSIR